MPCTQTSTTMPTTKPTTAMRLGLCANASACQGACPAVRRVAASTETLDQLAGVESKRLLAPVCFENKKVSFLDLHATLAPTMTPRSHSSPLLLDSPSSPHVSTNQPVEPVDPVDPSSVNVSPILTGVSPTASLTPPPPAQLTHRWSDYAPCALPKHEVLRLLRVVSAYIATSVRALTLVEGTRGPTWYKVQRFVEWMYKEGQLNPTVLVAAVAYLRAWVAAVADKKGVAYNWYYVVATALTLASKMVEDDPLENKGGATLLCEYLFGVYDTSTSTYKETLAAFNQSEARFLEALDYRVHITHDEYTELWRSLADDMPPEPLMTSPTSVATGVHGVVPHTKPHPLQLLGDLCTATVRRWFVGAPSRPLH